MLSSAKDTGTHYFLSLNFASIEIVGEWVSSSPNKCTFAGDSETNKGKQRKGGGGDDTEIMSDHTF